MSPDHTTTSTVTAPTSSPGSEYSEQQLALAARAGDDEAWTLLYRRSLPHLTGLAGECGAGDDAPRMAHEALIRAWRKLDTFDEDRGWRPWVRQILRNHVTDRQRRQNSRQEKRNRLEREPEASAWMAPGPVSPDTAAEQSELRDVLKEGLTTLDPDKRRVLAERLQGRSYSDLADEWDIPVGTLRSRAHAGRQQLRSWWRQNDRAAELLSELLPMS